MRLRPTTYTYKTVGACQIKADVFRPSPEPIPTAAIVFIHGGCLIYGSREGINSKQLKLYLEAGFTVISIDYRLAPETKLPEIISDLEDAFLWIFNSSSTFLHIDPQRLAVVGHSAGGYLALMSGCRVTPRPKAIVSFYGYGDIIGDWYSKPDPFYCQQTKVSEEESGRYILGPPIAEPYKGRGKDNFYLYCRQYGLWPQEVAGHDPSDNPDFFVQYCPVQNVTLDYPPTLLLHGNNDTDVPYQQSVLMENELSRFKVEHELITIDKGGHGFDGNMEEPFVMEVFTKVVSFLNVHTKKSDI